MYSWDRIKGSESLLEFLRRLRRPAVEHDIPSLVGKIDAEIEKLEAEGDRWIPADVIHKSLKLCLRIVIHDKDFEGEEVSLRDFAYNLGRPMTFIVDPWMGEFHEIMRGFFREEDKNIPLDRIKYAMEKALEKVVS